jgi:hypothetical protein
MRFYINEHRFYCGVDIHARTMYLCILDQAGQVVFDKNLPATSDAFLQAITPFRDGLVVAVECLFCWYWLADLCAKEQIAFVLGHALYMRAIHGGKSKNDQIDAGKIARLLRGGTLPQAYVYPAGMRETRDLKAHHFPLRLRGQARAAARASEHSSAVKARFIESLLRVGGRRAG